MGHAESLDAVLRALWAAQGTLACRCDDDGTVRAWLSATPPEAPTAVLALFSDGDHDGLRAALRAGDGTASVARVAGDGTLAEVRIVIDGAARVVEIRPRRDTDDGTTPVLERLLGAHPDVMVRLDANERVVDINRSYHTAGPAAVIGSVGTAVLPPSAHAPYRAAMEIVRRERRVADFEFVSDALTPPRAFHCTIAPIVVDGALTGFLAVTRDVTAQAALKAELVAQEERHRLALLAAGLGIWDWEPRARRVSFDASTAAALEVDPTMTGDELTARLGARIHPEDMAGVVEQAMAQVSGPSGIVEVEARFLVNGGYRRWRVRGQATQRDAHGAPVRFSGIFHDVEEERKSIEARRSLERQLQQSQRMESVGKLAGGIAHDFNNFLQVILGHASLALEGERLPPGLDDDLKHIREAATKASELTRQLLAFARQEPLRLVPTDVNGLVERLSKMLRRLLPATIDVDLILAGNANLAHADAARIDQVLLNLCLNARDAMPNGGRLTVETENVLLNGEFRKRYPWAKPGRYVLVSVSDTGVGMSPDVVERACEPFFTTKSTGEGTGLGLAVAYAIVEQHGGMLHIYSEAGVGTRVKVYLPIAERAASEVDRSPVPAPPSGKELVLVAEDDDMVRNLVVRILSRAGYRVLSARDGLEAVAIFREHKDEVKLVLLDAVMPRMTGRETCEEIIAIERATRILFTSGYSAASLPNSFLEAMKIPLLPKPYDPDGLLHRVREILDAEPPARDPA